MDFMTDEELDGYLVLRFWLREIFKKRVADGLYNNLVHELHFHYTHNMQSRRNPFHTRGGHEMLKKYYRPRYYCFSFALQ